MLSAFPLTGAPNDGRERGLQLLPSNRENLSAHWFAIIRIRRRAIALCLARDFWIATLGAILRGAAECAAPIRSMNGFYARTGTDRSFAARAHDCLSGRSGKYVCTSGCSKRQSLTHAATKFLGISPRRHLRLSWHVSSCAQGVPQRNSLAANSESNGMFLSRKNSAAPSSRSTTDRTWTTLAPAA